jgi:hypothetical protein
MILVLCDLPTSRQVLVNIASLLPGGRREELKLDLLGRQSISVGRRLDSPEHASRYTRPCQTPSYRNNISQAETRLLPIYHPRPPSQSHTHLLAY